MAKVTFILPDDTRVEAQARPGQSLLEVAHQYDIDIEGACEGSMACSTCHLLIDPAWYDRLPAASEEEEDMLDLAFGVSETSRLGCQVVVGEELDGLIVRVPAGVNNLLLG